MKTRIATLKQPLNKKQLARKINENGYLKVVVAVDLDDLITNDIEGLNDLCEKSILGDLGVLSDIAYRAVGVVSGQVLVEVTAAVDIL